MQRKRLPSTVPDASVRLTRTAWQTGHRISRVSSYYLVLVFSAYRTGQPGSSRTVAFVRFSGPGPYPRRAILSRCAFLASLAPTGGDGSFYFQPADRTPASLLSHQAPARGTIAEPASSGAGGTDGTSTTRRAAPVGHTDG